jgi:hypothetical protein
VKIIKFAGILGLVALTLLWSEKPLFRTLLNPILRILVLPMQIFASLVGAVLVLITWPVKKVIAIVKKS